MIMTQSEIEIKRKAKVINQVAMTDETVVRLLGTNFDHINNWAIILAATDEPTAFLLLFHTRQLVSRVCTTCYRFASIPITVPLLAFAFEHRQDLFIFVLLELSNLFRPTNQLRLSQLAVSVGQQSDPGAQMSKVRRNEFHLTEVLCLAVFESCSKSCMRTLPLQSSSAKPRASLCCTCMDDKDFSSFSFQCVGVYRSFWIAFKLQAHVHLFIDSPKSNLSPLEDCNSRINHFYCENERRKVCKVKD